MNDEFSYIVVEDEFLEALNRKIKEKIKDGYKLQGGVSVSVYDDVTFYSQAMVKGVN